MGIARAWRIGLHGSAGTMAGGLGPSAPLAEMRCRLMDMLAEVEAGVDVTKRTLNLLRPKPIQRAARRRGCTSMLG